MFVKTGLFTSEATIVDKYKTITTTITKNKLLNAIHHYLQFKVLKRRVNKVKIRNHVKYPIKLKLSVNLFFRIEE